MNHMPNLPVCPHCGTALPELATKTERLEAECSRLHSQNRHLKGELTKIQGGGSDAKDIEELHDEWLAPRATRPGRKPILTDDRHKAYRKLLKDYGKEDALKVIKQSAKAPFLVYGRYEAAGKPKERRDDITEIVAKASRVEQLLTDYEAANDPARHATPSEQPVQPPQAASLHNVNDGWTPINRAVGALKREGGWDTVQPEFEEQTLLDNTWDRKPPIVRWHSWCPCHPFSFVGLRLWDGERSRLRVECDGACLESDILRAIFALEDKQVERAKALLAFDRAANPQTLDKLVKALDIQAGESRYSIARKMGIHDDDDLRLTVDPRELKWAA